MDGDRDPTTSVLETAVEAPPYLDDDWSEPMLDVSVVVPVQSEDAEVREVVEALGAELDREGRSWECLFVFDGVTGRAWATAQDLHREYAGRVRSISFKNPFGEAV
jgi:hypothetical protein